MNELMSIPDVDIESLDEGGKIFALQERIKQRKKIIEYNWLAMGEDLLMVLEEELWDRENYDSFAQYLNQPGIDMQKSTAYGFIKVFKKYVLEWKINQDLLLDVGKAKLMLLLEKGAITEESVIDQLHMAKTLSKRDLMHELGVITLNEVGYIECQLKESSEGFYLHVYQGNDKFPPGVYRLTRENISGSDFSTICHFKGIINK